MSTVCYFAEKHIHHQIWDMVNIKDVRNLELKLWSTSSCSWGLLGTSISICSAVLFCKLLYCNIDCWYTIDMVEVFRYWMKTVVNIKSFHSLTYLCGNLGVFCRYSLHWLQTSCLQSLQQYHLILFLGTSEKLYSFQHAKLQIYYV